MNGLSLLPLADAVAAFFEAKARLLAGDPDFRLRSAGPLTCLHRHPNWPEVDGFYALGASPAETVAAVRAYGPDSRHMITVFTDAPETLIRPYGGLGYRPVPVPQPFMVRPLSEAPPAFGDDVQVQKTPGATDYWIERDSRPVCRGRAVRTSGRAIYVSGMETLPDYRRRGLASTVLRRIQTDARADGAGWSLLCSSPSGLPLYQSAGYSTLALMQAFLPGR